MRDAEGKELAVVGLKTLGATPRALFSRRKRTTRAEGGGNETESVAVTRLTVVDPDAYESESEAERWLAKKRGKPSDRSELGTALEHANRIVHAHRLASGNPYVHEISLETALRVRIGYGSGEQVADGLWTEALDVPPEEPRKGSALDPDSRLVEMLNGSSEIFAGDDLVLRASLDFDQGRFKQARLQALAAAQAMVDEGVDGAGGWITALAEPTDEQLGDTLFAMLRTSKRRMHLPS